MSNPKANKQEVASDQSIASESTVMQPNAGNQLGTFGGVFTPTILTILGVIMFMRANFVVGEAGIIGAIAILILAKSITFLTSFSISAIATNIKVRGGGSYYLISRVLGPEFGGAIGICLFIATALSAPFYIVGFLEALIITFPSVEPWSLWISLATAVAIVYVAYTGAEWAVKVQYVIMAILFAAIIAFMLGAILQFSPETLQENLRSGYTFIAPENPEGGRYSFWIIFAIYFPAVTGIDAGLNMSGDLKNPAKSIPRGTLIAVVFGFLVYLVQIILSGGAYNRLDLIASPFELLQDNAILGLGFLVSAGVFAATLSSALGSTLGAPRVLQALARDPILFFLKPFAKGTPDKDEPMRALALTAILTVGVLVWASKSGGDALNAIAAIITMFFLYAYGMINLAAFVEAFGRNPSFRPRFRFFHWTLALIGGLGAVFAAFLINPIAAIVAAILIFALVVYLRARKTTAGFGDARRGFIYEATRKRLLQLAETEEDAKNWRPTMIVFSGNPNTREGLVSYGIWLSSGRGIVFLADILAGELKDHNKHRDAGVKRLKAFCKEKNLQALPMFVMSDTVRAGVKSVLQTAGSGFVTPNLVVFGWCDDPEILPGFVEQLRLASSMGMSIIIIKVNKMPDPNWYKRVHLWWRGKDNGHLMMILAHLLKDNWEWANSDIDVLRLINDSAGKEPSLKNMAEMIHEARIEANSRVIISDDKFKDVLFKESSKADCVFLGFHIPEEGKEADWHSFYSPIVAKMRTTILIHSREADDLLDED